MKNLKLFYKISTYLSLILLILTTLITLLGNTSLNYFILIKSAEIGTYLLFLMLLVKSLYLILKHKGKNKNKLFNFLRNNNMYQREQGLIVFNIIFIHIIITTIMIISNINSLIFYYVSGIIPTIILIYMEITSFNFFQKRIRRWKKHHSIVWLTIPLIYIHVLLISTHTLRYLIFGIFILIIALIEKFIGLKKGTQHLVYLLVGLLLSTTQFFGTQLYNINKQNNIINESTNSQNDTELDNKNEQLESNDSTTSSSNDDSTSTDDTFSNDELSEESQIPSDIEDFHEGGTHGHGRPGEVSESSTTSTYTSSTETESDGTYTYKDGTYTGQGYGHVGLIEVETTIENDKIVSIEITEENEDDPWWEPVISALPDEVINNNSTNGVEYIAGSTHSSEGFLEAVDNSLANAQA